MCFIFIFLLKDGDKLVFIKTSFFGPSPKYSAVPCSVETITREDGGVRSS